VNRIGIPLDAATQYVFDRIKGKLVNGPYDWKRQFRLLQKAVDVFGKNRVSTHLIVGLGETEKEMVGTIQKCVDLKILPALFAFTPVKGTKMENHPQPAIGQYRRLQLARYLIYNKITRSEQIKFDKNERIQHFGIELKSLKRVIESGKPFITSGCSGCNRPYYNEKPSGPIFNYPASLNNKECTKIIKAFKSYMKN
jgi:biotin synthase